MPDDDGVLRARWRTDATPDDRVWAFLTTLRRGTSVRGTVTRIAAFGAFVDIGGCEALIRLPELSRSPVDHPSDVLVVGQEVEADILDVDFARHLVSMSLRDVPHFPEGDPRSHDDAAR